MQKSTKEWVLGSTFQQTLELDTSFPEIEVKRRKFRNLKLLFDRLVVAGLSELSYCICDVTNNINLLILFYFSSKILILL